MQRSLLDELVNKLLLLISQNTATKPEAWRHAMIEAVKQLDIAANIERKMTTAEKPSTVANREES